eukprot:1726991-Prymnesium_polylepis.2
MPGPSGRLSQHGAMCKVAVVSSSGAHNREKGAKSGRPPRTRRGREVRWAGRLGVGPAWGEP